MRWSRWKLLALCQAHRNHSINDCSTTIVIHPCFQSDEVGFFFQVSLWNLHPNSSGLIHSSQHHSLSPYPVTQTACCFFISNSTAILVITQAFVTSCLTGAMAFCLVEGAASGQADGHKPCLSHYRDRSLVTRRSWGWGPGFPQLQREADDHLIELLCGINEIMDVIIANA